MADIRKKAAENLRDLKKGFPLKQADGSKKIVPASQGSQIKYDLNRRNSNAGVSKKDLG